MKNLEIAKILYNIADMLELQNVEFKPKAYRNAARSIEFLKEDIEDIYRKGKLEEIPGVGKSIAEKITEYIETGKLKYYHDLKKQTKIDVESLNAIPGLGPKKIKVLYEKLGVKNVNDLEKAIRNKKLQTLAGFGEETEKHLLRGIEIYKKKPQRFLYALAEPMVKQIIDYFQKFPFVKKMEIAGSFRRGKETVGDLDFLAVSDQPDKVMGLFIKLPDLQEILAKGLTKSSIRFRNGMQADLRVVQEKEFGSAMLYFIGNKDHNIELRKLALSKGYTLSEYGLFKLKGKKWVAGRTENEIYQKLGLRWMEPEIRESMGEIKASIQNKLPKLVQISDLRGVFHNHSTWSEGRDSILEMAKKAEDLGYKFISFNDHSGTVGITNPVTEKRLPAYLKEIEKVQKKVGIKVFSGLEVDILKGGKMFLPKEALKKLDVVVASLHGSLEMPEPEMTRRICFALENYPVNIFGHPTCLELGIREPISVNLEKVFESARRNNVFLEINSTPRRMDLNGENVRKAIDSGCKVAMSTDAHSLGQLETLNLGILCARRGWAEKKDILNCWDLPKIGRALDKK